MYDAFVDVVQQRGLIDPDQLMRARRKSEMSGGSFDVLAYLLHTELISEDELPAIIEAFFGYAGLQNSGALEDGAGDFLNFLKETKQPFGILSYGNARWQELKIAACGLGGMPRMIVPSPHKAATVATWYQPRRTAFAVPPELFGEEVLASHVVLIDDKAIAFDGLHDHARGYWLQLSSRLLPSQTGDVPASVKVAHSYDEIIASEERRGVGAL